MTRSWSSWGIGAGCTRLRSIIIPASRAWYVLCFDTGQTESSPIFFGHLIFIGMRCAVGIHDTIHRTLVTVPSIRALEVIISTETPHTGSSSRAAALSLAVTSESIASCEFPITFGTDMRTFTSVQLHMAFQIVQSSKSHCTCLADVRLFLAVSQQMTFQVMMTSKFCRAIRTFVLLL